MASEWSQWMFMGPDSARLATVMTTGRRIDAAMYRTSHMKARPAEAVAVTDRAPAADAPMHTLMELCSDSVLTYSVWTSPSATKSEKASTMMVWGVMG